MRNQTPFVRKYLYNLFIIFAPSYVNSSCQNRFKCSNLHDLFYIFLYNGVMTSPKHRILSFVFTVLCFNKITVVHDKEKVIAIKRNKVGYHIKKWEKI